jgi:hypothetical protein
MSNVTVKQASSRAALRALKQPMYDTVEAPDGVVIPATPNLTFFQAPLGNALNVTGAAKTICETSLSSSGSIGVPNEFDLFGFNISFMYDTGYAEAAAGAGSLANFCADIVETYEASVFTFFFGNLKPWLRLPMSKMPQGTFGVSGVPGAAVATTSLFPISNGESKKGQVYKMLANDRQVTIHSAENFSARIDWPLANYALTADGDESRLVCYMVGVFYTAL